ncbi:VanW family protein [Rossellomorea aquimaris]|uniref:VanW family protein n=1 Tax=Rossellomorea aquimaris TaxID=189382 RepID=UPI001CD1A03D|nr:VanW family protein [Rossellomorea aquimaris]MCA1056327.1 VanW family protein [Rossellomorea aquimaris]
MKKSSYSSTVFLVLCTAYLFGSAYVGSYWYDRFFHSVSPSDAMVAGMKISNATDLQQQIEVWEKGQKLFVTYIDRKEHIPSDVFQFDVEGTMIGSTDGEDAPLLLAVDEKKLLETVTSLGIEADRIQIHNLKNELMEQASKLNMEEKEFALVDYLERKEGVTILAEHEISSVARTPELQEFLSSVPEIVIEPLSSFSILNFTENQQMTSMTNDELSIISTGLYKLVLQSGLQVIQRHHGTTLPEYAKLGFEARVDREHLQDFVFVNPDDTSYKLHLEMVGDRLRFVLEGEELPYGVELSLGEKQPVKHRVIKQYTPYVTSGQVKIKTEGKDGVQVEVWRSMVDSDGRVLKQEMISRDYYPPVHREELVSLSDYLNSQQAQSGENTAGTPETEEVNAPDPSTTDETAEESDDVSEGNGDVEEGAGRKEPDSAEPVAPSSEDKPDLEMK